MNLIKSIGLDPAADSEAQLRRYINLKLALLGCPTVGADADPAFRDMVGAVLQHHRESERLLADYLCPADRCIQNFLNNYLGATAPKLPGRTFVLDRHGLEIGRASCRERV